MCSIAELGAHHETGAEEQHGSEDRCDTPQHRRRCRDRPVAIRNTDSALAAGSASTVSSVQAATRTKPGR